MDSEGPDAGSSILQGLQSSTVSGGNFQSIGRDQYGNTYVFNLPPGTQIDLSTLTGPQNPFALSGDSGQGLSPSPLNPGTQPHRSVTPKARASIEKGESPNARYERHLLATGHGFPLWVPQPQSRLPLSYRQKGVSIGDVGIITREGYFDFLFNICLPLGHAGNPDFLPIDFSTVHLHPTDVSEWLQHDLGSCILTPSTRKQKGLLAFNCDEPEGSILVMPNGAYREDLRKLHKFKRIASQNAENWYRFAMGSCGRDIGNGELKLVTSCDKTNSWGIATYSDFRPGTLTLTANSVQSHVEYTWDYEGHVEVKAGPRLDESSDAAGRQQYPRDTRNQCIFLRSFTVTVSDDVWKTMVSTLPQNSSENHILNSPESRSHFPSTASGLFLGFVGRGGSVNTRNHSLGSESTTTYPAMAINQMLLSRYPNAKVAISHDNDWRAVIRKDEKTMPDASELLNRIRQSFTSHFDDDGTVYLSHERAPDASQQRQSLSPDDLVISPNYSGCAQGTLCNAADNTCNDDRNLSLRARVKQLEGPPNTLFSEEGAVLNDEVVVPTPKINTNNQDTLPSPLLKLGDSLVISSMVTTHLPEDNLHWLNANVKQLHKVVDGYPDLHVQSALVQNSLCPRLYIYTLACLKFLPSHPSTSADLTYEYSRWIALDDANRLAQFQTILNSIWGVLKDCSGARFLEIQRKAKEIIKFDYRAIAAQIVVMFSIRRHRKALLDSKQPRKVHQGIINLLQELIDVQDLKSLRFIFLKILLDLSKSSGLDPSCLLLKGVQVVGSDYVDAGAYGNIWKGELKGRAVAIKVVRHCNVETAIKQFSRKAILWRRFHHPNVLPFLGVYLWAKGSDQQISLVSPWMENGNFTQYLQKNKGADPLPFILDIALGIEYLHTFTPAVIHGALKGTNILITPSHRACVADFGLRTLMQDPALQVTPTSSAFAAGALLFLAPELIGPQVSGDSEHLPSNEPISGLIDGKVQGCRKALASDIYSFGCVCYEAYTGHPRFFRFLLFDAMTAARENRPVHKPAGMTETVWSLVQSCWQVARKKRPTIKAIISSLTEHDAGEDPITAYIEPRGNHEPTSSSPPISGSATPRPVTGNPDYPSAMPPLVPEDDLRLTEKDIIIALMGPSGTGKSSFINKLMGQSVAYVSDSVDSCTQEVQAFACLHPDGTGRKIVLIDTPGFDDSGRTDYDILKIVVQWLTETYTQRIKLTGIIQLYSIADPRMRGTPLRNLKVFEELCGSNGLANVILTTTFWSQVTPEVGLKRQDQLKSEFWAEMIKRGCRVERFDPWSYESAWKIIDLFNTKVPRRQALKVQIEIVDKKKKLLKTSAYQVLAKWWDHVAEKCRGKISKEAADAKRQQAALKERRLSLSPRGSFMDVVQRSD